jgi:hypothetical protein
MNMRKERGWEDKKYFCNDNRKNVKWKNLVCVFKMKIKTLKKILDQNKKFR